ncbi:syntaxin 1A-like protein [Reticulomyxa filosa]|uniref:Syntaxin 1A-like protein n=1 Tax=Reticulomyxa filosa TaxID=46433 RepID=X6NJG7_RETFI|nr:syntaxin 1A-like protein [Reticulomyxa filosa]|eukprot:ETO26141.1 syntaxin 1A-like protein [Reticulomyxa filosa]
MLSERGQGGEEGEGKVFFFLKKKKKKKCQSRLKSQSNRFSTEYIFYFFKKIKIDCFCLLNTNAMGSSKKKIKTKINPAMLDRLNEIESRTQGMMKIYESLEELRTMWHELNFLISAQQEYLDSIENNVEQTKHYVAQATIHLGKAEKSQKTSRKVEPFFIVVFFPLVFVKKKKNTCDFE